MSQETYVMLFDALTGEMLHPEVKVEAGQDTTALNGPGDVTFTVPVELRNEKTHLGGTMLAKREVLAAAVRPNGTVRAAGLIDESSREGDKAVISCGGISMLPGQSGPWEGHQGWYTDIDPVVLFRRIWEQTQSYNNAIKDIRITGDTRSGSSVGYSGSARWRNANNQVNRLKPQLEKLESRLLARERTLEQRKERMFKAAGLKRVGQVHETDDGKNPPDDPEWKADSTLWIRKDQGENGRWGRAYRWRSGRWISQSQADSAVRGYRGYVSTVAMAKDEVDRIKYLMEPYEDLLEEYGDEARQEFSTYFWQDHDMGKVIDSLLEIGNFEFREKARVVGNELRLELEVGAPRVGVRREELHLELGFNVQDHELQEPDELFTEVAQFGAGSGSEVLSEQRTWNPPRVVRNVYTDTDSDAHNRALVRAAANRNLSKIKDLAGDGLGALTITHGDACPEGSFQVGDQLLIVGDLLDGTAIDGWYIVKEATHVWGSNETDIEVEPA